MLGQSYTLTCTAQVTDYLCPVMFYWWTKNSGTVTQLELEDGTELSFSSLRLSDAQYACLATVSSFRLSNAITVTGTHKVRIQENHLHDITRAL